MSWTLGPDDLKDLARGAAILGTGGILSSRAKAAYAEIRAAQDAASEAPVSHDHPVKEKT